MNNQFASYEQSLALRDLGFNEPCLAFYNGKFLDSTEYNFDTRLNKDYGECISAPLKSQVFDYFRINYGYHISIFNTEFIIYTEYSTSQYLDMSNGKMKPKYVRTILHQEPKDSYEEAESGCLDKLIELIKNGNKCHYQIASLIIKK
jgi:hypothetical protein